MNITPTPNKPLSLFALLLCLLATSSPTRPNSYLKLVRYNYAYATQLAQKNKEKYFTKEPKLTKLTHFSNQPQAYVPTQKLELDFYDFPGTHGHDVVDQHELIQKLFAEKFSAQPGNHFDFKPKKNAFVPLRLEDGIQHLDLDPAHVHWNNPTKNKKTSTNTTSNNTTTTTSKNTPKQPQSNTPSTQKSFEDQVNRLGFEYLNQFRTSNGLSPLQWDQQVFEVSRPHSLAMAQCGRISHDGFDARASRLEQSFFVYQSAENVAYFMVGQQKTPSEVARKLTDQWINSPGHRRNMLLPGLTHAGVSIVEKVSGGFYYYGTQFFVKK